MNIVIKNENYKVIDALEVEVIKTFEGIFTKETIEKELVNFYYNKAIIDITGINNYYDETSLFEFLDYFGTEKVILILNDSEFTNSKDFLRKLVLKGYYNFTKNSSGVSFLLEKPNTYDDVKKYAENETFTSALTGDINNSARVNNFNNNANEIKIIGIKNLTEHAGATTLMYMMLKQLRNNYKVKGIEVNKNDSLYFRDNDIVYATSIDDARMKISSMSHIDAVLVDINDSDDYEFCSDVLFLVEPGTIRLNKLMKSGVNLKEKIGDRKVILNRSSIKDEELSGFEYETGLKVFYNLVNFDERKERIQIIDKLLVKLGFTKQEAKEGFFHFFK